MSSKTLLEDKLKAPPFRKREVAPTSGGGGFVGSSYSPVMQGLGIKQIVGDFKPAGQHAPLSSAKGGIHSPHFPKRRSTKNFSKFS